MDVIRRAAEPLSGPLGIPEWEHLVVFVVELANVWGRWCVALHASEAIDQGE
jgi:hypothetical protein